MKHEDIKNGMQVKIIKSFPGGFPVGTIGRTACVQPEGHYFRVYTDDDWWAYKASEVEPAGEDT
jgi:hypothetical protein